MQAANVNDVVKVTEGRGRSGMYVITEVIRNEAVIVNLETKQRDQLYLYHLYQDFDCKKKTAVLRMQRSQKIHEAAQNIGLNIRHKR